MNKCKDCKYWDKREHKREQCGPKSVYYPCTNFCNGMSGIDELAYIRPTNWPSSALELELMTQANFGCAEFELKNKPKKFEIRQDLFDATSITGEPDPNWFYIDKKGHKHKWGRKSTLPTLCWKVDVEATDEYPELGHYECKKCGEEIEPGTLSEPWVKYIPGLVHYYIDDVEVPKDRFEKEVNLEKEILKQRRKDAKSKRRKS